MSLLFVGLWPYIALYRLISPYIAFSRGHRSKFIWFCFSKILGIPPGGLMPFFWYMWSVSMPIPSLLELPRTKQSGWRPSKKPLLMLIWVKSTATISVWRLSKNQPTVMSVSDYLRDSFTKVLNAKSVQDLFIKGVSRVCPLAETSWYPLVYPRGHRRCSFL